MKEGLVITFEQLPNAVCRLFYEIEDIKQLVLLLNKNNLKKDNWLNLDELINYLPEKPAKATVYTWVSNQLIPFHKKGKKLFFLESEIDNWLKEGRRKTALELEEQANSYIASKKGGRK